MLFYVTKTKVLISCAVTAQLIRAFVFPYAKSRVYHDMAQLMAVCQVAAGGAMFFVFVVIFFYQYDLSLVMRKPVFGVSDLP